MIDPRYYGLVELVLIGAGVLAFGGWQLWDYRRYKRRIAAERSAKDAGHPPRQHRLDDGAGETGE